VPRAVRGRLPLPRDLGRLRTAPDRSRAWGGVPVPLAGSECQPGQRAVSCSTSCVSLPLLGDESEHNDDYSKVWHFFFLLFLKTGMGMT